VRRPRQAQRPQPSPPGLHRRRPRRSAPPKRRVSVRSWGRVARRLELGERALRRRGCFGARENYYPVLLELASPRSGRPYSRVRPLHRPPAGRKEPPNPIPETHNEHLRRQTLEPCRPCAATTPRATHRPAVAGFWTRGSVHLVVASAAASLAGCRQTANWTSCKLSRAEKSRASSCAFAEPSDGLEPSTPSLP
jgi:hypothetical protein